METSIHAARDGRIAEVIVKAGEQVNSKDLIITFE